MPAPVPASSLAIDPGVLWVMHCAEGPVPIESVEAVRSFLDRELRPWKMRVAEDFFGIPDELRAVVASLVGSGAADVTLTASTSDALTRVAQCFPFEPGDEVLLPLGEFPSNFWPWRALEGRGLRVREVPLWPGHRAGAAALESTPPPPHVDPEARLLEAIGPRTRLVSASFVRFQDGLKLDVAKLARECRGRGVPVVVDAIQGIGTVPFDATEVAAVACGAHKGLLAPQGMGFLVTSPALREELRPGGSWLSVEDADAFARPGTDFARDWYADGRRFELGVPNLAGAVGLLASLRCLARAGIDAIRAHEIALERRLLAGLDGVSTLEGEASRLRALAERDRLGSILSIHHRGGGAARLDRWLESARERGIYASAREGYLRIALHGWHTPADVDRLVEWLRK